MILNSHLPDYPHKPNNLNNPNIPNIPNNANKLSDVGDRPGAHLAPLSLLTQFHQEGN